MRLETVPEREDPGPMTPTRRRASRGGAGGGRGGGPLGPDSEIGARLRALYAEVEQQPIPSDLIDLLEQLDEAERREGQA